MRVANRARRRRYVTQYVFTLYLEYGDDVSSARGERLDGRLVRVGVGDEAKVRASEGEGEGRA